MIKIPPTLQQPQYRFYKVKENSKLPLEPKWNTTNNYQHTDNQLLAWLDQDQNYGIVCGIGNIIILDFDDRPYYESVKHSLPKTFTVLSATKRLPHLYYHLKGEMMKKTAIKNEQKETLCDIQASRCGIIAPNSSVGKNYYDVHKDIPIAEITKEQLKTIFKEKLNKITTPKTYDKEEHKAMPEEEQKSHQLLHLLGIKKPGMLYECPFHAMKGNGNLSVLPNGRIWCFHEARTWFSRDDFTIEYYEYFQNE